jgi:hypothetical protein
MEKLGLEAVPQPSSWSRAPLTTMNRTAQVTPTGGGGHMGFSSKPLTASLTSCSLNRQLYLNIDTGKLKAHG